MKRREFVRTLCAAAAATTAGSAVQAQVKLTEGKEYTRLTQAVPVAVPGKIEVIEFFGYWCPHCNAFEPTLDAWARKLPPDVNFRRVPVAFNASHETLQKLYFALEVMGLVPTIHRKVFTAFHGTNIHFDQPGQVAAFATANGIDPAKLNDTMQSFSVATKCRQVRPMLDAYRVDGVPTMAVNGRFLTSVGMAGGNDLAVQVLDALIQKSRAA